MTPKRTHASWDSNEAETSQKNEQYMAEEKEKVPSMEPPKQKNHDRTVIQATLEFDA